MRVNDTERSGTARSNKMLVLVLKLLNNYNRVTKLDVFVEFCVTYDYKANVSITKV